METKENTANRVDIDISSAKCWHCNQPALRNLDEKWHQIKKSNFQSFKLLHWLWVKERIIRRAVEEMFKWISELCTSRLQHLGKILIYYSGLLFYNYLDPFQGNVIPARLKMDNVFHLSVPIKSSLWENTLNAKTRIHMNGLYPTTWWWKVSKLNSGSFQSRGFSFNMTTHCAEQTPLRAANQHAGRQSLKRIWLIFSRISYYLQSVGFRWERAS